MAEAKDTKNAVVLYILLHGVNDYFCGGVLFYAIASS